MLILIRLVARIGPRQPLQFDTYFLYYFLAAAIERVEEIE